jgi:hypothetical protein
MLQLDDIALRRNTFIHDQNALAVSGSSVSACKASQIGCKCRGRTP